MRRAYRFLTSCGAFVVLRPCSICGMDLTTGCGVTGSNVGEGRGAGGGSICSNARVKKAEVSSAPVVTEFLF